VSGQLHARFTPGKERPVPILYKRLGGPQSRSGRYGEVKIFYPTGTLTLPPPRVVQPVASRYTDWAIPAHEAKYILVHLQSLLVVCLSYTSSIRIQFLSFTPPYLCQDTIREPLSRNKQFYVAQIVTSHTACWHSNRLLLTCCDMRRTSRNEATKKIKRL
jgi:hypothetical protein